MMENKREKGDGNMICSVRTLGVSGIQGSAVTAECYISQGLPGSLFCTNSEFKSMHF